ncbi:MAG TPA: PLP-dependent aminotransferase family protein [Bryobacteraceae bacterium]|jgi:2-aminoadipate transaminase|nr:PLP-dependent aminotransferase family protein [Bryobacteraceae bacterium]
MHQIKDEIGESCDVIEGIGGHMAASTPELVYPVAAWARDLSPSALQIALGRAANQEILSLSLGLPDPALFPMAPLQEACFRVLANNRQSFQYGLPSPTLKLAICRHMAYRGVECSPEQVFITMGAQQGLSLLARLLLDTGATVLEETFSYTGFQQAIRPYEPHIATVPTSTAHGIDVDALEDLLSSGVRPAFLYVMADGHNPLGATIPHNHRERLADLARRFRVPIIEDDPYGFLEYDGFPIPAIRAFESDWVYYVGSFSKLLAPSLRVGWLIVPRALTQALEFIKEGSDINTGSFTQWVVSEFLEMDALPSHLGSLRREYGARRQAMAAALRREFPTYCRWRTPQSGVFFWIELPEDMNGGELLNTALEEEQVSFLPAEAFSRGLRRNGMRLNFSRCNSALISEAVRRIGRIIEAKR